MAVEDAGYILRELVSEYQLVGGIEEGSSITEDSSRFREVMAQLRDVVETSQSSDDISSIKEKLEVLEGEVDSTEAKNEVSSVVDLAAKSILGINQGSPEEEEKDVEPPVKKMTLVGWQIKELDFSELTDIKELKVSQREDLTAGQFNAIPATFKASIKTLDLRGVGKDVVTVIDFSSLTSLENLDLGNIRGLTKNQFNAISDDIRANIKTLDLTHVDIAGFDFSGFTGLKSLTLEYSHTGRYLSADQFNAIPENVKESIEHLELAGVNVKEEFDFSEFTNLKSLNLNNSSLYESTFNDIPDNTKASIEHLDLSEVNVGGFDLSEFAKLKSLNLKSVRNLFAGQFNNIPEKIKANIETLNLSDLDIEEFDLSGFTGLKNLSFVKESTDSWGETEDNKLTAAQFNAIPKSIRANVKTLDLKGLDVTDFDFSGFTSLESLNLSNTEGLSSSKLNTAPASVKKSIKKLDLSNADISDFDFSGFTRIKELDLSKGRNGEESLTAEQFNAIPEDVRASIKTLNIEDQDVTNFDFSGFTSLTSFKNFDLNKVTNFLCGLTATQFNVIPARIKAPVEKLEFRTNDTRTWESRDIDITGFDFSGFTGLKDLNLVSAEGLTATQFNTIPLDVRDGIQTLWLNNKDVTDFDFSGFISLESLSLQKSEHLTAAQFNAIPEDVKTSIKNIHLFDVDVTGFDFSGFTGVEILDLQRVRGSILLPENIGSFTHLRDLNLSGNQSVTGLPTSVLELSEGCTVNIERCGLSQTVLDHLQESVGVEGYQGPRFNYSMEHHNPQIDETKTTEELLTNLYALAKKEQPTLENLPKDEGSLKV
jgi:hypothetical protein